MVNTGGYATSKNMCGCVITGHGCSVDGEPAPRENLHSHCESRLLGLPTLMEKYSAFRVRLMLFPSD